MRLIILLLTFTVQTLHANVCGVLALVNSAKVLGTEFIVVMKFVHGAPASFIAGSANPNFFAVDPTASGTYSD